MFGLRLQEKSLLLLVGSKFVGKSNLIGCYSALSEMMNRCGLMLRNAVKPVMLLRTVLVLYAVRDS